MSKDNKDFPGYPPEYDPEHIYSQPNGISGPPLDNDFAQIANSVNHIIASLKAIQRDDHQLANWSVDWDQLSESVKAAIGGVPYEDVHVVSGVFVPITDELILTLSNGEFVNCGAPLGRIGPPPGDDTYVVSGTFTPITDELILTLSDGTTVNCGAPLGPITPPSGGVTGPDHSEIGEVATWADEEGKVVKSESDVTIQDGIIERVTPDTRLWIKTAPNKKLLMGPVEAGEGVPSAAQAVITGIAGVIFALVSQNKNSQYFSFIQQGNFKGLCGVDGGSSHMRMGIGGAGGITQLLQLLEIADDKFILQNKDGDAIVKIRGDDQSLEFVAQNGNVLSHITEASGMLTIFKSAESQIILDGVGVEIPEKLSIGSLPPSEDIALQVFGGAFLPPAFSESARDSLNVIDGCLIFNTDSKRYEKFTEGEWSPLAEGESGVQGPGSSTDNAIPVWVGTGGDSIRSSEISIDGSRLFARSGKFAIDSSLGFNIELNDNLNITHDGRVSIGGLPPSSLEISLELQGRDKGLMLNHSDNLEDNVFPFEGLIAYQRMGWRGAWLAGPDGWERLAYAYEVEKKPSFELIIDVGQVDLPHSSDITNGNLRDYTRAQSHPIIDLYRRNGKDATPGPGEWDPDTATFTLPANGEEGYYQCSIEAESVVMPYFSSFHETFFRPFISINDKFWDNEPDVIMFRMMPWEAGGFASAPIRLRPGDTINFKFDAYYFGTGGGVDDWLFERLKIKVCYVRPQ